MDKCFVLGVGAQKAGTSWFRKYLSTSENSNFGITKEYHVWDALYVKLCRGFIADQADTLRFTLQHSPGAYEDYFSSLVKNGSSMTGDFTPSYSALPSDCFTMIRSKLESRGFNVKVVFLMRDPFERCWSRARSLTRGPGCILNDFEILKKLYSDPQCMIRTNYKSTIESLEAAFDSDQIYYGIYEEMFEDREIKRMSDFFNVPVRLDFSTIKVNTTTKLNSDAIALKNEIRNFYAEVYDFCFERFPQTKNLWKAK